LPEINIAEFLSGMGGMDAYPASRIVPGYGKIALPESVERRQVF
jgi:hypothetical protein